MKKLGLLLISGLFLLPFFVYASEGNYISSWDTETSGNICPTGITTNENYFWITDCEELKVYKYDINGNYISSWDLNIDNESPMGIGNDNIYIWITDTIAKKTFKYDINGNYISSWDLNELNGKPSGLTTDGNYIWITDKTDAEVYKYDITGSYESSWDTGGSGNGAPQGITFEENYFWVGDYFDKKVYKYDINGNYISSWDLNELNIFPEDITTNGNYIWVVDDNEMEVFKYEGIYTFLLFSGSILTGILNYSKNLFTDLWTLVALAIGLPLAFWVIRKIINLGQVDKKHQLRKDKKDLDWEKEQKRYEKIMSAIEKREAKKIDKWVSAYARDKDDWLS